MKQERNKTLDIAKAICICLMVMIHSGCPDYLQRFIYIFLIPCFFFISGFLLNDKYLKDLKTGVYAKTKGSYYIFVKWSLIFLLFHNVFSSLHIYESNLSLKEFGMNFIRVLTMRGSEQLLGGYWFLISLFWASIFSLFFLHILYKKNKMNSVYISLVLMCVMLIAIILTYLPIKLPSQLREQTFLATAFYMCGYLYRKMNFHYNHSLLYGMLLFSIPLIVSSFTRWDMTETEGWQTIPFCIVALFGAIGLVIISAWLSQTKVSKVFAYVGNKTLYIFTFHFLAFKLVSFLYIKFYSLPIEQLSQFPTINETSPYMWMVYSVVGVGASLLIWEVFHWQPTQLVYRIRESIYIDYIDKKI